MRNGHREYTMNKKRLVEDKMGSDEEPSPTNVIGN
jgi:hypothetical protein